MLYAELIDDFIIVPHTNTPYVCMGATISNYAA